MSMVTTIGVWIHARSLAVEDVHQLLLELGPEFEALSVEIFEHLSVEATLLIAELQGELEGEVDLGFRWAQSISQTLQLGTCGLLKIENNWEAEGFNRGVASWNVDSDQEGDLTSAVSIFARLSKESGRQWSTVHERELREALANGPPSDGALWDQLLPVNAFFEPAREEWRHVDISGRAKVRRVASQNVGRASVVDHKPVERQVSREGDTLSATEGFPHALLEGSRDPSVRCVQVHEKYRAESWLWKVKDWFRCLPINVKRIEIRTDGGLLAFEREGDSFQRMLLAPASLSNSDVKLILREMGNTLRSLVLEFPDDAISTYAEERGLSVVIGSITRQGGAFATESAPSTQRAADAATVLSWLNDD